MINNCSNEVKNRPVQFGNLVSLGKPQKYDICSESSSTTSVPDFKYLCNSIPELLNVFEDPAQCMHIIVHASISATSKRMILFSSFRNNTMSGLLDNKCTTTTATTYH